MKLLLIGFAGLSLLATGCVSSGGYNDAVNLLETERQMNGGLKRELLSREAQIAQLEEANKKWQDAYNRAVEIASQPVPAQVVVQEVPIDGALDDLRNAIGKELTSLDGDWNVIRAQHAVGVRLDDGQDVLFMPGSWKLTDKATASLGKLATALQDTLKKNPDYVVRIDGHTDSDPVRSAKKAGIEDNVHLGFMRAQAVRTFLIEKGIVASKVFVLTAGENLPVGADKKLNRRVEVWVSNPAGFSLTAGGASNATVAKK